MTHFFRMLLDDHHGVHGHTEKPRAPEAMQVSWLRGDLRLERDEEVSVVESRERGVVLRRVESVEKRLGGGGALIYSEVSVAFPLVQTGAWQSRWMS